MAWSAASTDSEVVNKNSFIDIRFLVRLCFQKFGSFATRQDSRGQFNLSIKLAVVDFS